MSIYTAAPSVLIRAARGSDGAALARLAELDSRHLPSGQLLVAESDGEIVAALGAGGERIADPFRRTADVMELLELRAGSRPARARRGIGLHVLPHPRMA